MRFKLGFILGVLLSGLLVGCGDGSDEAGPHQPPFRPATQAPRVPDPIQSGSPVLVVPCGIDQYVQATPRLSYEVKVTQDADGLTSLSGVLMDACMGQTDPGRKATMETLAKGIQEWLEKTYPKGSTETTQEVFEEKVCQEIARLVTQDASLRRITWVSLATHGTFSLTLYGVGTPIPPPKITPGPFTPPGCKIPKPGPTA